MLKTLDVHKNGFVSALRFNNGNIYSGGKDGKVNIISIDTNEISKTFDMQCLVRAIDATATRVVVGLRNGSIVDINPSTGNQTVAVEAHSNGELWGLAVTDSEHFVTSCDDNKVKTWNLKHRKCENTGTLSNENRKAPKGGAASLT